MQAATTQTNRRHVVAVAQLIMITLVYVISFVPLTLEINDVGAINLIVYAYYINHVCNFFIYLAVNKEFRKEAHNLVYLVAAKIGVRPRNIQPPIVDVCANAAVA